MKERILWSYDLNPIIEDLRPEMDSASDEQLCNAANDINNDYFEMLQDEYSIETETDIAVFAELGLWNGISLRFARVDRNIKECFRQSDCNNIWKIDENGDLVSSQAHHDGTNHLLFRRWKKETTDENIAEISGYVLKDDRISAKNKFMEYSESLLPLMEAVM